MPADKLIYVETELREAVIAAVNDGYTRFISGGTVYTMQYARDKGKTIQIIKIYT